MRKIVAFLCLFLIMGYFARTTDKTVVEYGTPLIIELAPTSVQVHYYLVKYADKYEIPRYIAFGVARKETGYKNWTHFKYNPEQTSSAKAYGVMQVQTPTARYVQKDDTITNRQLLTDIEYNIETSMKYLRQLKDRYGSWAKALGYYNTGYPVVNDYALSILSK